MLSKRQRILQSAIAGIILVSAVSTSADVTMTGDVVDNGTTLRVGDTGTGNLDIDGGSTLSRTDSFLGYSVSAIGTATVTGAGSVWNNTGALGIGREGTGSLTVADGGLVTAKSLHASFGDLNGNGTIQANGGILDTDIAFSSTNGLIQSLPFGSGGVLALSIGSDSTLGVGHKTGGSLTISEAMQVTASLGYLGYQPGTTGNAMVTGAGSKWILNTWLYVGSKGTGNLNIYDGAEVSCLLGYVTSVDNVSTVTINGGQSKWTGTKLILGTSGAGVMTLENGGALSLGSFGPIGSLILGRFGGSDGELQVIGPATATVAGFTDVGYDGGGRLRITDGGAGQFGPIILGRRSGSTGDLTVTGVGSTCIAGSLSVGFAGAGAMLIEDGGQLISTTGTIGNQSDSTGTATVTGSGSTWTNNGNLIVGLNGTATLTISDSGQVIVTGTTTIGPLGTINISGGTLESAGGIVNNGTINHAVGSQLVAQQLTNDSLNSLNIHGSAEVQTILGVGATNVGNGTDPASLAAGTIRQATLTINDNASVTLAPGGDVPLRLGTAGLSIAPAGKLDLTDNDLILSGMSAAAVRSLLITGFNSGDWAGNGLTSSAAQNDPTFYTALGYADNAELGYATFSGQSVSGTDILVKYTFYGDTDLNGVVDSDDLTNWIDGFNGVGSQVWLYGDFDYSGVVDSDDLTLWVDGFLNTVGPLSASLQAEFSAALASGLASGDFSALQAVASSIVPEPASLSLLALGALALRRRRR